MTSKKPISYPYIPNSEAAVKKEMLKIVGAASSEDFFADIPEKLRYRGKLKLPPPLLSEYELVRHVENLLENNRTARENLNFLGAGSYQHHVPETYVFGFMDKSFCLSNPAEPHDD